MTSCTFSLLVIRGVTLVTGWLQQGWNQLSQKLKEWTVLVSSYAMLRFIVNLKVVALNRSFLLYLFLLCLAFSLGLEFNELN